MANILERYAGIIKGVLGCYDRVVITGTLPGICHAAGMTSLLYALGILVFDYTKWAEPMREAMRIGGQMGPFVTQPTSPFGRIGIRQMRRP